LRQAQPYPIEQGGIDPDLIMWRFFLRVFFAARLPI